MPELKPCPLCGSTNLVFESMAIYCVDCSIKIRDTEQTFERGGLVQSWNTRQSPASIMGSKGGKSTSEKKRLASQRNGKLGGKRKKETGE